MSTPPFSSIPFSIAHPQQPYRLLELPPDLLALLTSDEKPEFLDLKSSAAEGGGDSDGDGANNNNSSGQLHLCTPTLSWAVRQVSTSNSVHVTVPISIPKSLQGSTTTIAAVAKPTSHLELIGAITTSPPAAAAAAAAAAASSSSSSSSQWLREIVQGVKTVVPTVGGEVRVGMKKVTKEHMFAALPYPRAWIRRAMSDVLVFAVPDTDGKPKAKAKGNGLDLVYIPSPALVVDAWMRFTRAAAEQGIDIVDGVDVQWVIEAMATSEKEEEGEDEYSGVIAAGVMRAVFARFTSTTAIATDTDMDTVMTTDAADITEHRQQLQAQALTLFLGRALVRADAKSTTTTTTPLISKSKLLQKWTALVPLSWERYCIVEELGSGIRVAPVEGVGRGGGEEEEEKEEQEAAVYWDGDDDDREGEGREQEGRKGGGSGGGSGGGGQGDKKRKWHDMFAKERRNG